MSIQYCEECCQDRVIDCVICTDCQTKYAAYVSELSARIEVLERQRGALAEAENLAFNAIVEAQVDACENGNDAGVDAYQDASVIVNEAFEDILQEIAFEKEAGDNP